MLSVKGLSLVHAWLCWTYGKPQLLKYIRNMVQPMDYQQPAQFCMRGTNLSSATLAI